MTMLDHVTIYSNGAVHGHYLVNNQMITCVYNTEKQLTSEREIPTGIKELLNSVMGV